MMKKDNIKDLFKRLEGGFDVESPNEGHQQRFLDKLNEVSKVQVLPSSSTFNFWKPLLAIAASLLIGLAIFTTLDKEPAIDGLASVSPELSETQDFFNAAISQELNNLNSKRTPETEALINDALKQISLLETDYNKLKMDLKESGNDKRVVYAMISNFQNRIELLQNVMAHIEDAKNMSTETPNIL
ncbi:hypothetical protein [Subsaximicrobium wynnwilliamsii]|nr:hypothetical protein [Subsaximicrobium wynnwilliamsii]